MYLGNSVCDWEHRVDCGDRPIWTSFHTENNEQYDSALFQELDSGKSIIFTVQAPNDAHIGFMCVGCSNEFYEIVIGGSGNAYSVIRRKMLHTIGGETKVFASTPGILHGNEYRPFWADALNGLVRLGKGNIIGQNVVMQWQDPNPIIPNSIGFMTGWGATGDWNIKSLGTLFHYIHTSRFY